MNLSFTKSVYTQTCKEYSRRLKLIALLLTGLCLVTGITKANATPDKTKRVDAPLPLSSIARLSGLTISVGHLSPAFTPLTVGYSDTVSNATTSVTVTATPEQAAATIKVNGVSTASSTPSANLPLTGLNTTITIVVTAEDGTTKKTYTITVHRLDNRTLVNSIYISDNYAIAGGYTTSPSFSNNVTSYTIAEKTHPADDQFFVRIYNALPSTTAKVNGTPAKMYYGTSYGLYIPAHQGINNIAVEITAEDRVTTKTFNFSVPSPYDNTDLSRLQYSTTDHDFYFKPAFNKDSLNNWALTKADVNQFYLGPLTADQYATVKVNGVAIPRGGKSPSYNLGQSAVVVVTGRDGVSTKTYTVNARHQRLNNNLASYTANAGTLSPAISTDSSDYMLKVPSGIRESTITFRTEDSTAKMDDLFTNFGTGSLTLKANFIEGSKKFNFYVTPQDNDAAHNVRRKYTLNIIHLSGNAKLKGLVISSGTITPDFTYYEPETTIYRVTVSTPSVTIKATTDVETSTMRINGVTVASGATSPAIPLALGDNTITTLVTAQDTAVKRPYTIIVTRVADKAVLSNIATSTGTLSPAFAPATSSYQVNVTNATSSITIKPFANSTYPNVTVKVNGTSVTPGTSSVAIPLSLGNNPIAVVVTSADQSKTFTYTVNVTRLSDNANLTNLTINPGHLSPAFAAATQNYGAFLTHTTTSVTITATPANPNVTMTVDGQPLPAHTTTFNRPLNLGSNVIQIVVTSQDGSKVRNYLLSITRPSDNSNLRNLSITSGPLSPAFAINTLNYTVSVPNDSTYTRVKPYAENSNAPITVNGTDVYSNNFSPYIPLVPGPNTISIVVTSQDSSKVRTYKIVVTRLSNNANLAGITLSSGTLSPAFTAGTTSYTASVTNATSSITVKPVAVNGHATMKVNGNSVPFGGTSANLPLAVGNNTITVTATSEDLSKIRNYTVTVTRAPASFAFGAQTAPDISPRNKISVDNNLRLPLVRQAVSPNGDGINDILLIDGIDSFADNMLKIMNRDGNLVFEKAKYDNISHYFDGHSGINGKQLPAGTYFYSFDYTPEGSRTAKRKTGFFVLKY